MPTYQYECKDCRQQFEQFQKFSDEPLTICPSCEGRVRRVIQIVGVVFKGSGWYINDSRPAPTEGTKNDKPAGDATAAEKPAAAEATPSTKAEKPVNDKSGTKPAPAAAT